MFLSDYDDYFDICFNDCFDMLVALSFLVPLLTLFLFF